MPRIEGISARGIFQRAVFWAVKRRLGTVIEPLRIVARRPRIFRGVSCMEWAMEKSPALPEELKDLVNLAAAKQIGCSFCIDIGSAIAQRGGISEKKLRALPEFASSPHFSQAEKLCLQYAHCLTRTPPQVPLKLFEELRSQIGEEGIVELTAIVCWENYRARFNHALDVSSFGFCSLEAESLHAVPDGSEL